MLRTTQNLRKDTIAPPKCNRFVLKFVLGFVFRFVLGFVLGFVHGFVHEFSHYSMSSDYEKRKGGKGVGRLGTQMECWLIKPFQGISGYIICG